MPRSAAQKSHFSRIHRICEPSSAEPFHSILLAAMNSIDWNARWEAKQASGPGATECGSVGDDLQALELRGEGLVAGDAEEAGGLALDAVGLGQGAAKI